MSQTLQTDVMSDIDIESPPSIHWKPKHIIQNILKRIKFRLSKILLPVRNFYLSKQKTTQMTSTTHQNKSILVYNIQTFC
jgi:hypothetical protein